MPIWCGRAGPLWSGGARVSLLFTPVSYICAAWMKKPVQQAGAAYKKAAGALSAATLDRVQNAVTYRICGCESAREARYEEALDSCEKTAVRSNVRQDRGDQGAVRQ